MEKNISVLMSVYKNDIPENIAVAIDSIINQTLKPKQCVIVVDGPVSDKIKEILETKKAEHDIIELHYLEKNVGLGNALNYGAKFCKYEFIARMDSDDISVKERFQKQMDCFEKDAELSLVSSDGQEFFDVVDKLAGVKGCPEKHEDIVEFMKARCPFCHMSVMMKKDALEKAGWYQDWYYAEDYYLWIRMYLTGAKFYNIQENLVWIRINEDTFARRHGLKYYKSIKNLLKYMKNNKIIGFWKYSKEKIRRFIGHVLIPRKLKNKMYMKYLRKGSR